MSNKTLNNTGIVYKMTALTTVQTYNNIIAGNGKERVMIELKLIE